MSNGERLPRSLFWLASAIWLPPAAVAIGLAAVRPEDASVPFASGLLGLALCTASASFVVCARFPGAVLAACSIGLLLWPELSLRIAGLRFDRAGEVHFGFEQLKDIVALERDPELFWRLDPAQPRVNSAGFLGPEFAIPKPDRALRFVFFGDSCTQQGYPALVSRWLNQRSRAAGAARRFDAVNLGVAGYTSYQGLRVAERWAESLEPDLGVIFFGWNDHWLAYGASDATRGAAEATASFAWLRSSRLAAALASLRAAPRSERLATARVSLPEYRANLAALGERIERAGGRVLLLTAPSAHRQLGVPDYLMEQGFADDARRVLDWHRAYNDEVRALARERAKNAWILLDLAREADQRGDLATLFGDDGIHFTRAGLDWVRDRIVATVEAAGLGEIRR